MTRIFYDYPLISHNTFGMDVKASVFAEFESEDDLRSLLTNDTLAPYLQHCIVIGAGSNLLFGSDFEGLVLHSRMTDLTVVQQTDEYVKVRVGSGYVWDDFVAWSVKQGYFGAENLSAIPGEVGASAVQNIGAYGAEVSQLIECVEAMDKQGNLRVFSNEECCYGYRDSIFKGELKGQYVITHVTYRLMKQPCWKLDYGNLHAEVEQRGEPSGTVVRDAVQSIRKAKLPDPAVTGNAGSFFKNPVVAREHYEHLRDVYASIPCYPVDETHVKVPAGWLIEQCGWKGRRWGRVAVHEKQALVLVNLGGATGNEVMEMANRIADAVERKFGICISPEVNYI